MKRQVWKGLGRTLWIVPYVLVLSVSDIFLAAPGDRRMADVMWYAVWGRVSSGEVQSIVMSLKCIGGIFLFAILFGEEISVYFGGVSTVYFTRVAGRGGFLLRKTGRICGFAVLYSALFLATEYGIGTLQVADSHLDMHTIFVILLMGTFLFSLLVMTCLLVNLLSIQWNVTIAVFLVFAVAMVLEYVGILLFDHPANIVLNPLCANYLIVENMGLALGKIGGNFAYLLAVFLGMYFYVRRKDIF